MDQQTSKQFFDYLGSHLVALCGVMQPIDRNGKPIGEEQGFSYTGFVIELDGTWYFVTAGHVLGENIGDLIDSGKVKLITSSFAGFFGRNAVSQLPCIFPFEAEERKIVEDSWKIGLDIGVIELRELYVAFLKSNGVVAIPEKHWLEGDKINEQNFLLIGFPEEEKEPDPSNPVGHYIRNCIAGLTPCKPLEDTPTANPLFVGKLNSGEPDSVVGFSGGPIFRYKPKKKGYTCWLHAVQARWKESKRVTFGCPMTVVAKLIREKLPKLQVELPKPKKQTPKAKATPKKQTRKKKSR